MSRQVGSRRLSSTNKDHQYDNIHGNIRVPPLLRAVIDTPQFNRLRSIKQLGLASLVYPSADHNRYTHSIGVMHLADEFIVHLRKDESLCITEVDHLCVMMAGLCHDLGHGPFSHLWEVFMGEAQPGFDWHHVESIIEI
jgi:HD superfamily phosphohydrolase